MSFNSALRTFLGWDWLEGGRDSEHLKYEKNLSDGYEASQADGCWHLEAQELADGVAVDYDLTALERAAFGDTLTTGFGRVKLLSVVVTSTTAGTLFVGNSTEDPWWEPFGQVNDSVEVPPDSVLVLSNKLTGWTVLGVADSSSSSSGESTAGRMLRLRASGGTVTFDIAIVGVLAASVATSSSSGA